MLRKIIRIDREKCNGCGACAEACHENAIGMEDGKAVLLREDYCDGLGDCLPVCPTGAITFEEREAAPYDEQAVMKNRRDARGHSGCPGHRTVKLNRSSGRPTDAIPGHTPWPSQLAQWPCQIKLVPVNAPYFDGARLLIAADCTAYAYTGVHEEYMRGRITLIGCPKLAGVDYSKKLAEILRVNAIQSLTVLRMEVPCCGGLEAAAKKALRESEKFIPWQVSVVSIDGRVLEK